MTLKVFCNICDKEANDEKFMFEATIMEEVQDLTGDVMTSSQMKKLVIHVCKNCYKDNLKEAIYGEKKDK